MLRGYNFVHYVFKAGNERLAEYFVIYIQQCYGSVIADFASVVFFVDTDDFSS